MRIQPRLPSGFTLVELLAVLAIVALVATLAFPAVSGLTRKFNAGKGLSNLRQLGVALSSYSADNNGWFPRLNDAVPATQPYLGPSYLKIWTCPNRTIKGDTKTTNWGSIPRSYVSHENVMWWVNSNDSDYLRSLKLRKQFQVPRPAEVVLLIDATQKASGQASNAGLNGLGDDLHPFSGKMKDPSFADRPIPTIGDSDPSESLGFIRYRQPGNKANVVFVDGHVAQVSKGTLNYKNFATTY